jgi:hypothetical protein
MIYSATVCPVLPAKSMTVSISLSYRIIIWRREGDSNTICKNPICKLQISGRQGAYQCQDCQCYLAHIGPGRSPLR